MKKTLKKTLVFLLVLMQLVGLFVISPASALAAETTIGNFKCIVLDDGTLEITGLTSTVDSYLIIPATLGGYTVSQISESAFEGNSYLKSVAFPSSVRSIGNYAFYGCSSLENIFLSSGVESIGDYAFASCDVLQSIYVDDKNTVYTDVNGVLMSYDGKTLICCPGGRYGKVIVPDGVTHIARNAFCWCSGIEIVVLPDSVVSIGRNAFNGCGNLAELVLPAGITSIEKETFAFCSSLVEITIPNGATSIGEKAFYGCSSLKSATIPESVVSIAENAFKYDVSGVDRPLSNLTVYCQNGSSAMLHCQNNGISFVSVGSTGTTTPSAPGPNTEKVQRIAGSDRINTAILISREGWASSSFVVLANGFSYPDALAGVPLAAAVEAPILLTSGKQLEPAVLAEIKRLGAGTVYILGGTAAIGSAVENALNSNGFSVRRLSGSNRYETAVKIALELELRSDRKFTNFFLVSSQSFADALSISAVAAIDGNPILYVPKDGAISDVTAEFMYGTVCRSTTIIGGTAAVSKKTEQSVATLGFSVARLSGADRYRTALAICEFYRDRFPSNKAIAATGANFPDALAGGALAAHIGAPLVLVNDSSVETATVYLDSRNTTKIYILGGIAAVPESIADKLGN